MKRLRYENGPPDAVDHAILEILIADARASNAEIARQVGLSAPSVGERIRRLEEAGIITGYAAQLDPAALGAPIAAWIRVRPLPGRLAEVIEIARATPEIVSCDRITGEDCLTAKAHVADIAALERLIDRFAPAAATYTSIVQSSPVAARAPALPGSSAPPPALRRRAVSPSSS